MDTPSWDRLRIALAVERAGSIRGAARALGINHATVSRHLHDLQARLGVRLFERDGQALVPTVAGADLIATAEQMEEGVLALGRRVAGRDFRLRGRVRVSLTPSMLYVLASSLPELSRAYPDIDVEIISGLELSDLSRREADIVVRIAVTPPSEHLYGRRVSDYAVMVYGASRLLDHVEPCALAQYPWVAWGRRLDDAPHRSWRRAQVPDSRIVCRTDTALGLYHLIRAGLGVGLIPSMLGDADPDLRRVSSGDARAFTFGLWTLTHADLRGTARVRAVLGWLSETLASKADLFAGLAPPASHAASPPGHEDGG
jgi:DNA-binding transcriptional LysR family regulator